jgi:SanA protein
MTSARLEAWSFGIKARRLRWFAVAVLGALVGGTLMTFLAERFQEFIGDAVMTADIARMPVVEAAVVLGTSKLMPDGSLSITFSYRLDAAAALWKAGKAKYLIVSGNHTDDYDEPSDMRTGLIERGVLPEAVYRDGKGFRTWDSMVRARDVFGLKRLAVVSQRSHVARALFIARCLGLEAFGFEAKEDPDEDTWTRLRPYPAAVLSYYDALRGAPPHRRHSLPIAVGVDPAN